MRVENISACILLEPKQGRRFILAVALCLTACCAHADGQIRKDQLPDSKPVFCAKEIEEAIEGQGQAMPFGEDRLQAPAIRQQGDIQPAPQKTGCARHPWVRQLQSWNTQGMSLEAAMQWLVMGHDAPGSVRLQPQLEGAMEDIARMRAAFTLVSYGHLADAHQLWADLSVRRPRWTEVWFNLGLIAHLQGDGGTAAKHFNRALQTCRQQTCSVEAALIEHWIHKSRSKP